MVTSNGIVVMANGASGELLDLLIGFELES